MRHVLVIRLSALGDVAIMAPVVELVSAANPEVRFTVAGPPLLEPLFEGMANVDYLGLMKKQSARAMCRALDAVEADTVVDLHRVNRVGRALALLRWCHLFDFRFRIFSLRKGRLSRWMFIHHLIRKPRRPQYERYEDVFRRAGLTLPPAPLSTLHSPLSTCIGIAPFAQHEGKIWPHEYTRQLIGMLAAKGCEVVLFGSRDEAPLLEEWAAGYENVRSVAGRQPFREELEIIRSLGLMVSMDSANMHFASALGVPVVSIWGATHPDFGFYGYGQNRANAICADLPCQPCSAYGRKPCRYGDRRCLRAVTPQMVMERIEALLPAVQA